MRFQISSLITDETVSRTMALVESVPGEFFEQIEDRVGFFLWDFVCPRTAFDEILPLFRHFFLVLLPHGAPEQIGLSK